VVEDRSRLRVVSFIQSTAGGRYDTVLVWSYGQSHTGSVDSTPDGIDPHDVRQGIWTVLNLPAPDYDPISAAIVERDIDKPELWAGVASGGVYFLQDPDEIEYAIVSGTISSESAISSGTTPVASIIETTWAPIGASRDSRGEPRYLGVNARTSASGTWTATVSIANDVEGTPLAQVSFPIALTSGFSSPIFPVPSIGTIGAVAKVRLENSTANQDAIFTAVKLYYVTRIFEGTREG